MDIRIRTGLYKWHISFSEGSAFSSPGLPHRGISRLDTANNTEMQEIRSNDPYLNSLSHCCQSGVLDLQSTSIIA